MQARDAQPNLKLLSDPFAHRHQQPLYAPREDPHSCASRRCLTACPCSPRSRSWCQGAEPLAAYFEGPCGADRPLSALGTENKQSERHVITAARHMQPGDSASCRHPAGGGARARPRLGRHQGGLKVGSRHTAAHPGPNLGRGPQEGQLVPSEQEVMHVGGGGTPWPNPRTRPTPGQP